MYSYFFITGTSKGIGYSLALNLIEQENNIVFALSRNNKIQEKNYHFNQLDLADTEAVQQYQFPPLPDAKKIILINNAGVIGDIKPIGKKSSKSIANTISINTTAPLILTNNFIKAYQNDNVEKIILNVSSGAGRHAIHSWADYCASKSAMDMFSLTIKEEQSTQQYPIKIFSVAPGIVDTTMQKEIRTASSKGFPLQPQFVSMKNNKELASPQNVASQLIEIIANARNNTSVILDVRET